MKIGIFTNTCYETIVPLVKELTLQEHKVDFYAMVSSKGSGKALLFENDALWKAEKPGNVIEKIGQKKYISDTWQEFINYGNWFAIYFHNFAFVKPRNWFLIYKVIIKIKNEKYDVLHFNVENLFFLILAAFFKNKNIVFQVHDPEVHSGEDNWQVQLVHNLLKRHKKARFIVHSSFSADIFIKNFKSIPVRNIYIIPFGPHEWLKKYETSTVPNTNNVLFFGRISPYKGIEYLLKAAKILLDKMPDLTITIAGSGNFNFNKNPIPNNVKIINQYIQNEELVNLLISHRIVVCPYTDATQSGVVQTALVFNKPIIATNVGAMSEMIIQDKTGIIIPPRDSEALANAIIKMVENERYNFFANNIALAKNELNSWANISQKIIQIYA